MIKVLFLVLLLSGSVAMNGCDKKSSDNPSLLFLGLLGGNNRIKAGTMSLNDGSSIVSLNASGPGVFYKRKLSICPPDS
jgi:hypothetical protein